MYQVPHEPEKNWVRDSQKTIDYTRKCPGFIRENRLWEGFRQYRWLVKGGIIILIILGIDVLFSLDEIFSSNNSDNQNTSALANIAFIGALPEVFGGGMKYLMLIAIEIVIFHFTRRSMMIITGEKIDTSFGTFLNAEMRMIKVAIFSYFMEIVLKFCTNTLFDLSGATDAAPVVIFFIQSFYLGFAIIDNYNELFHMTIKQSHRYTWHFAPVAIITGAIVNVLLLVPALGVVVGTVICSVIATLTMHELTKKSGGMDWIFVENNKLRKPKGI